MADALAVHNLRVHFYTRRGIYKALNGVELRLQKGEVLGIAGESGCGKSTLGLTILSLLPRNASIPSGQVVLGNRNLVNLQTDYAKRAAAKFSAKRNEKVLKRVNKAMVGIRGLRLSMVFQEPMTALNPVLQVGYQVAETVYVHDPALLARRALARTKATPETMRALVKVLQEKGDDPEALVAFAKEKGIPGIEEQALFIWRRTDIHVSRKARLVQALCEDKITEPLGVRTLEAIAKWGHIPIAMRRTPIVTRLIRRILFKEGYHKAEELLTSLGIPHAERVVRMYPHELSGGMRQRVVIAIALANNPEIIIMDEPTSAVDVTVQAQILELVKRLRVAVNASFIFISHDLSVLAEVCDRIAIMYAGRVVEIGPTTAMLQKPLHPYTQMLISAIPTLTSQSIQGIPGEIPDMRAPPTGCSFHPRCPFAFAKCTSDMPTDIPQSEQLVSCWLYEGKQP